MMNGGFYRVFRWGGVIAFFGILFFQALVLSLNIPTNHLDGAFQTASGLYRLAAGQLPGRDFFPYLGLGPLFLLYPVFAAAGGLLASSVFASYVVTMTLGWGSVSFLWYLLSDRKSVSSSLIWGGVFYASTVLFEKALTNNILFSFEVSPGNSLRPIRASICYISALLIYCSIKNICSRLWRDVIVWCVAGSILLWSNDYAITTYVMFILLYVVLLKVFFGNSGSCLIGVARSVSVSIFVYFPVAMILTDGAWMELVKFNFIDVARDQWWYFAGYGYGFRVFSIGDVLPPHFSHYAFIFMMVVMVAVLAARRLENWLVIWIGLALTAGGSAATLGGISAVISTPCGIGGR